MKDLCRSVRICSNFIQIAELLRLIVQAELHLGHPLQDRRVLLGRFMSEPTTAANDHLLPSEYVVAILRPYINGRPSRSSFSGVSSWVQASKGVAIVDVRGQYVLFFGLPNLMSKPARGCPADVWEPFLEQGMPTACTVSGIVLED